MSGGLLGGINSHTYVEGDPVSFVDLTGLASTTIGFFPGVGGQVTFGQNPNGSGFMSFQFGWGIGGGFTYNPDGKQPGYEECQGNSWGASLGVYGQASFRAGPLGTSLGANLGRSYRSTGSDIYGGFPRSAGAKDKTLGLSGSVSGGGQFTVFGGGTGGKPCTCQN